MSEQPSVRVEPIADRPALLMTWEHVAPPQDVEPAFAVIADALDQSEDALWVVVDLTANPQFPIVETVLEALSSSFRHERLAEWLVIDPNSIARLIADMLTGITGRSNIRWFDSGEDAYAYLDSVTAK